MKQLSDENLNRLRAAGLLFDDEIAFKNADLLIAENVISGKRRVLGPEKDVILKEEKKILKG